MRLGEKAILQGSQVFSNGFGLICGAVILLTLCAADSGITAELDELLEGFEETNRTDPPLDELLDGFSDQTLTADDPRPPAPPILPSWLELQGGVSLWAIANIAQQPPAPGEPDYRGLSMLRTTGELIADTQYRGWRGRVGVTAFYDAAYSLNGQRSRYTDAFLDEYETELELQEAYLQGTLFPSLDIKCGRQIVVWGSSDTIRVTDIINPLDQRVPGMVDVRFLRLPVTITRLDYYKDGWNVTGLLIHEPRFTKLPVYNGEFFPFNRAISESDDPDWSLEDQQFGLAVNGIFSGWDMSLYAASVFDPVGYVGISGSGGLLRYHDRAAMFGGALTVAAGNWLVKGETAYWSGLRYATTEDDKDRFDILAGLEYSGFDETMISAECANRHILDFEQQMAQPPDGQQQDWTQYSLRITRDFYNDRLQLTILLSSFGLLLTDGGFARAQLEYELNEHAAITGGTVFYRSGDFPGFNDIGNNDRIFTKLEYRF
jgi:hypothetical protein